MGTADMGEGRDHGLHEHFDEVASNHHGRQPLMRIFHSKI
jgi:hypothetical protein